MEDLNDIATFIRVVERNSFTAAGKELRLSSAAVSKRISRLEESLGAQLLNRSTRRLMLTEAGTDFYKQCSQIISHLEQARNAVTGHNKELKGTLRIHAALGVGQRLVAPAIHEFLKRYPEVMVDLALDVYPINPIEHGIDIAIRSAQSAQILRLSASSLSCRELSLVRNLICAAPAYLTQWGTPKRPQDLAGFNCLIHSGQPQASAWRFRGRSGEYTVNVSGNFHTNNGIALRQAVLSGVGIARLPDYAVNQDVQAGRLVTLFSNSAGRKRSIKAFYPRTRHMPAKVQIFLDFMEEFLRRHPQAPDDL
jgi:DNA-binding transcriptional LysR family regulator